MKHTRLHLVGAAVLLAATTVAQSTAQDAGERVLPKAETLFERHIESTGGAEARRAVKTRKRTGRLEVDMGGHEFDAKVVEHSKAPGKSHVLIDGAAFSQVTVTNGGEAWEWRPDALRHGDEGADAPSTRLLEGAEKERSLAKARLHAALEWRETYTSMETVGMAEVGGKPVYEVRATKKVGGETRLYYDQASGRLVKRATTEVFAQMGKTKLEVYLEDYAKIGAVWEPMTVRVQLDSEDFGEGVQLWTYSKVENNAKVASSLFELPEELKKGPREGHGTSRHHE